MHIFVDYLLPFFALISAMVIIHEMGHYLAARMIGLHVTHFSVGMGPLLLSRADRRGCLWQIRALPIGGYVRMLGDADASSRPASPDDHPVSECAGDPVADENGSTREPGDYFHLRPLHQRAWVIVAGPLANFVAGIVIVSGIYFAVGRPYTPPVVGQVVADSPADIAGLLPGDRIATVDGRAVERFEDFAITVATALDMPVELVVLREDTGGDGMEEHGIIVTPEIVEVATPYGPSEKIGRVGVVAGAREILNIGPGAAAYYGVTDSWRMTVGVFNGLMDIVVGRRSIEDLGGPVKIAEISGNAAKMGWISFALLAAVISINLGVINLLPIPVLDGGHLALYAAEAIRGKPPSKVAVNWAFRGGAAALLALFACVTFYDVARLITVHIMPVL